MPHSAQKERLLPIHRFMNISAYRTLRIRTLMKMEDAFSYSPILFVKRLLTQVFCSLATSQPINHPNIKLGQSPGRIHKTKATSLCLSKATSLCLLKTVFEELEALGLSKPVPKPEPKKRGRKPKSKDQVELKPKRPRGRPRKDANLSAGDV